jgi:hypothetical protein
MSLCPHGVRIEHRRCDQCEEIAHAENELGARALQEEVPRRQKARALLERAKQFAHCNCPEDEETGRVTRHSNCQRHLMPILEELETLL